MATQQNILLNSVSVDRLLTLVEEATRATKETPRRFIEPARGTLDRAKSRRHHIVFGRRGSGKTSLLRKAGADLTLRRIPIAFIDLEAFKGHAYPDVLLSVLIETLNAFDNWLGTAGLASSNKRSFWGKIWGGAPDRPPLDKHRLADLRVRLQGEIKALEELLHSEDDAELIHFTGADERNQTEASASITGRTSAEMKTPLARAKVQVDANTSDSQKRESGAKTEATEKTKRNKMGVLHRKIIDFQKILDSMVDLSGSDAFIFLDDLYHLRRSDQAHVLDYFHRIAKVGLFG